MATASLKATALYPTSLSLGGRSHHLLDHVVEGEHSVIVIDQVEIHLDVGIVSDTAHVEAEDLLAGEADGRRLLDGIAKPALEQIVRPGLAQRISHPLAVERPRPLDAVPFEDELAVTDGLIDIGLVSADLSTQGAGWASLTAQVPIKTFSGKGRHRVQQPQA
jgi:hypothetical protein